MPAELGASFDHVAIAGRRIRDMLPLWRDTLGGRFVVGADNAATGWRAVRLELGGIWCVELIEPLLGSAFLDDHGSSGDERRAGQSVGRAGVVREPARLSRPTRLEQASVFS